MAGTAFSALPRLAKKHDLSIKRVGGDGEDVDSGTCKIHVEDVHQYVRTLPIGEGGITRAVVPSMTSDRVRVRSYNPDRALPWEEHYTSTENRGRCTTSLVYHRFNCCNCQSLRGTCHDERIETIRLDLYV